MSKFALIAGQGGAAVVGGVAVVAVGVGLAIWQPWVSTSPEPVAQPVPVAQPAPEVVVPASPEPQASPKPVPAPMAPRLTFLRVDPDGAAQIAGQADPGALVELLLDGAKIAETTAGRDGTFAHLFDLPPSDAPRAIGAQVVTEGVTVPSGDQLLVQPVVQIVAQAPNTAISEPAATAETTAEPTPAAPAVVLASPEGVTVLQPATPANTPPEVLDQVALDSISYDDAGEVALTGRGGAGEGGFVRVYLDNKPITDSRISEDGRWRTDLPAVDSGVYTLRVDQVDATGQVTSRVETPFKREEPTALAATAPADATVRVVTVQPGATLWAIARARYGEGTQYLQVFEANRDRIRNPNLIYPGQVFDLPEAN